VITVEVKGLKELQAELTRIAAKEVPFATELTLNGCAWKAKAAVEREVLSAFDRPTPFVQKGLFVKRAFKNKLIAEVKYKDVFDRGGFSWINPVADTLSPQVYGGPRRAKSFEARLRYNGMLPDGYFVTPGPGAKLDAYGNWSRGHIVQVLAYLQQFQEAGFAANITTEKRDKLRKGTKRKAGMTLFAVLPNRTVWGSNRRSGLAPGIWETTSTAFGRALRPVAFFVRQPVYRQRLDFYGVAQRASDASLRSEWDAAVAQALSTAR